MDSIQFVLIQAALIALYYSSEKNEEKRYSLNTSFYLNTYHDELENFIVFREKENNNAPYIGYNSNLNEGQLVTHSICLHAPSFHTSIYNIKFDVYPEHYELPWMLNNISLETILKRFNAIQKHDYNGATLAVKKVKFEAGSVIISFNHASYYSYLATNLIPEVPIHGKLTYRCILEPGPKLNPLESSLPENHLGLSCLFITSDGYIIIPKRSKYTNVFKEQLSPSVSGAGNSSTCFDDRTNSYNALAWLRQEASEELPFLFNNNHPYFTVLDNALTTAQYIGMSRELRRCGKPEIFFQCSLPILKSEIQDLLKSSVKKNIKCDSFSIDRNENETYFFINQNDLLSKISLLSKKKFRFDNFKFTSSDYFIMDIDGSNYVISESLLINIAFKYLSK